MMNTMQTRCFAPALMVLVLLIGLIAGVQAQTGPRIAVTDLAYTAAVSEYFQVGMHSESAQMQANRYGASASYQGSGSYVAGRYSYMEQRELGSFTNDIKGALI